MTYFVVRNISQMGNEQPFLLCSGTVIVSLVAVIINSLAHVGGRKYIKKELIIPEYSSVYTSLRA